MTKILVDTNIILDVLLGRQPWLSASLAVWVAVDRGQARGYLAAHAVTTMFYVVRRLQGEDKAWAVLPGVLRVFRVATVDETIIRHAARDKWPDFEDSVQTEAGVAAMCDFIVTRNPRDFSRSPIPVLTPEEVIDRL